MQSALLRVAASIVALALFLSPTTSQSPAASAACSSALNFTTGGINETTFALDASHAPEAAFTPSGVFLASTGGGTTVASLRRLVAVEGSFSASASVVIGTSSYASVGRRAEPQFASIDIHQ